MSLSAEFEGYAVHLSKFFNHRVIDVSGFENAEREGFVRLDADASQRAMIA